MRLKYAYVLKCDEVVRDPVSGEVIELLCSYDERTKGGITPEVYKSCTIQYNSKAYIYTNALFKHRVLREPKG